MSASIILSKRLREVFLDGKWIANTNYQEQIIDLSWHQASLKIYDLNSVALLTFHINYYLEGLLQVFNSGKLEISDRYSFDMKNITTEKEWNELKLRFLANAEAFCNKVAKLDEAILNEVFVHEKYGTYLRNIEAIIEHSYYHLGQVVLIKKMILSKVK
jgi:uncharacterized damage-inducible protein DinB